jgi:hypothetical protein
MVDGSVLVVRCDGGFLAPVDVRSTHTLNVRGQRIRQWEWMPPEHILAETTDVPAITARLDTLLGLAAGRRPPSPDAVRAVDPVADFVQPGGGHRRRVTGIRLGSIPKR